jgi:hypothetical protein
VLLENQPLPHFRLLRSRGFFSGGWRCRLITRRGFFNIGWLFSGGRLLFCRRSFVAFSWFVAGLSFFWGGLGGSLRRRFRRLCLLGLLISLVGSLFGLITGHEEACRYG